MKLATFESYGFEKVGVFVDGKLIDIDLMLETISTITGKETPVIIKITDAIENWEEVKKEIEVGRKLFKSDFFRLFGRRNPKMSIPLTRENKVFCLGKNYSEHAKEVGSTPSKEPIIFAKLADCAVAHGDEIVYPDWATRIDPEVELAVVIGRGGKDIPKGDAYDYVFGYTIANDVTERDIQSRDIKDALPWFRSKNFDTSLPVGPWIVTKDEIKDPHSLKIELSVNGQVRQSGSTSDMIFKIDELISFISKYMTLYPGDMIITGTIAGIAPVKRGDEITCTIEGIGTLTNKVI